MTVTYAVSFIIVFPLCGLYTLCLSLSGIKWNGGNSAGTTGLFKLARQRTEDPNVAAARRLQNAAELIGVVLAWLLALCPNLICNSFGKTNRVLILSLTVESLTFYKTTPWTDVQETGEFKEKAQPL